MVRLNFRGLLKRTSLQWRIWGERCVIPSKDVKMKNLKEYFGSLRNKEVAIHIIDDNPSSVSSGVVRRAGDDYVELEVQSKGHRVRRIYPYNAIRYVEVLW